MDSIRLTEPTGVISGVVNAFAVTDVKWTDVTETTGIADMVGVVSERIQSMYLDEWCRIRDG